MKIGKAIKNVVEDDIHNLYLNDDFGPRLRMYMLNKLIRPLSIESDNITDVYMIDA